MRYLTISTTLGFATSSKYIRHTPVLVLRPTVICSTRSRPLRILRRTMAVLVRRFSVNPSLGPRTTVSVWGSDTLRFSQPLVLTTSPEAQPSTSKTVSPIRQPATSSGSDGVLLVSAAHSTCCSSAQIKSAPGGTCPSFGRQL